MPGRTREISRRLCALPLAMAVLAGCGIASCGSNSAAPAEMMLHAQDGPFQGTLLIDPSPPQVGLHHVLMVLSRDPDGQEPLEGANVRLSPWMPAHAHGTGDVEAVEAEPGVYVADDVLLHMPGIWDLRVHVDARDAAEEGDLVATVEVP